MKQLALALTILASAPVDAAAACHRFSHWYYPWPQRCGVARQMTFVRVHQTSSDFISPPEIPLPGLARADLDGGEADEASRARLLLRAAVGAPDDR